MESYVASQPVNIACSNPLMCSQLQKPANHRLQFLPISGVISPFIPVFSNLRTFCYLHSAKAVHTGTPWRRSKFSCTHLFMLCSARLDALLKLCWEQAHILGMVTSELLWSPFWPHRSLANLLRLCSTFIFSSGYLLLLSFWKRLLLLVPRGSNQANRGSVLGIPRYCTWNTQV